MTTGSYAIKTNRHSSVKHNHVFCSVMTTCFGLKDQHQATITKNLQNEVQYRENCALSVGLVTFWPVTVYKLCIKKSNVDRKIVRKDDIRFVSV